MNDSISTLRRQPGGSGSRPTQRRPTKRGVQPHHRRRRLVALVVLAVLVLVIGIAVGSGGSSTPTAAHASAHVGTGYFTRIETLAGTGTGSFIAAEKAAENAPSTRRSPTRRTSAIAGAQHQEIALTFDDGPGPYTPQFVSVLKQYHVPGHVLRGRDRRDRFPRRHVARSPRPGSRSATTPSTTPRCRSCRPAISRPSSASRSRRRAATARRTRGCSARRTACGIRRRSSDPQASSTC